MCEEYVKFSVGDKFWFMDDLKQYEVVKETERNYYACAFLVNSSAIIHISKTITQKSFDTSFTEHHHQALELRIADEVDTLEYHKTHAKAMRDQFEKEQNIADSIRL